MASHHRILMVGDDGVILYAPAEKGIDREAAVSWGAPDFDRQLQSAFGASQAERSVVVLFNEGDQTYRKEENILPVEQRPRLEAAFPNCPNRAALEIYPRTENRDPKTALRSYLFVLVPETERLGRLGGALSGAGVPVAGFGVLPVESSGLVEALAGKVFAPQEPSAAGRKSRWAILSGQHETGGLRHVVIKDGNLALTRLVPVPNAAKSGAASWAEATTRELNATMAYVRRFGYADDDGMDVMVLCGEAEKQLFDAGAIPGARLRCLTLSEALRHLGCNVTGQDGNTFADALHAAWTEQKSVLQLDVPVPSVTGEPRAKH